MSWMPRRRRWWVSGFCQAVERCSAARRGSASLQAGFWGRQKGSGRCFYAFVRHRDSCGSFVAGSCTGHRQVAACPILRDVRERVGARSEGPATCGGVDLPASQRSGVDCPPDARAGAFFGAVAVPALGFCVAGGFRTLVPALVLAACCSRACRCWGTPLCFGKSPIAESTHGRRGYVLPFALGILLVVRADFLP